MKQHIEGLDAYILSYCPISTPGIEVSELVRRCGKYERVIQELILSGNLHCDPVTNRVWILQVTNDHRVQAFQMISPSGIGMSGFAEQLPRKPEWQEVVFLIASGNIEGAQEKAAGLNHA